MSSSENDSDTGERIRLSRKRKRQSSSPTTSEKTADQTSDGVLSASDVDCVSLSSESSIVDLTPEPHILFAKGKRLPVKPREIETTVGNIWEGKTYHIFQRPDNEGLASTHALLLDEPHLQQVVNHSVPQEYQGIGYFAVRIADEVLSSVKIVLEFFKEDGNRTWSQRSRKWSHFKKRGQIVNVLVVYYSHARKGFCKTVSFIVDAPNSPEISIGEGYPVIIRYYWTKGHSPSSFDPKEHRETRLPTFYKDQLASKFVAKARGPTKAPRYALQEVIEDTAPEIIQANPSFQISSTRQVKTAKQTLKNQHYGRDKLQYMIDSKAVETHFYKCMELEKAGAVVVKRKVHFVFHHYQLDLLAKYAFGPGSKAVDIDVKFKLTNAYAVVMTSPLNCIVHKERGTAFTFFGFVALVERKDELAYEEIALWFHSQMIKRGVPIVYDDIRLNLKIKTDDEGALYNPFIKILKAVHVLCSNHLSQSFERNMRKRKATPDLIRAWLRRIFGDPDRVNAAYITGTVDEDTLEGMKKNVRDFERSAENLEVLNWLLESRNGIRKVHAKMGPSVRKLAGVYPNLPHTNNVEGMNNLLGLETGNPNSAVSQCELADRLDSLFLSGLENIARSLMELGDYTCREAAFAISRSERNDGKTILAKLNLLFGADPDPEKRLAIWKGVVQREPAADFAETCLGKIFRESGLGMHNKVAFLNAEHYVAHPEKITEWPFPSHESESSSVLHYAVQSENDFRQQYHVYIDVATGKHDCRCEWAQQKKQLCKHVVAVASSKDLIQLVASYVNLKNRSEDLSFPTVLGGGKKPSRRPGKTGKGYTDRTGLNQIDTSMASASFSVEDDHPQAALVNSIAVQRSLSPGRCVCDCINSKPWQKGKDPFFITKPVKLHALCCCPGCKTLLKNKTDSQVLVAREEFDYKSGTAGRVIIPSARKRYYCMRTSCIRSRHPKFLPTLCKLDKLVTFTDEDVAEIAQFKSESCGKS